MTLMNTYANLIPMLKEYVHDFTHLFSLTYSHNNTHTHTYSQMKTLFQVPALKTVVLANIMKCVVMMVDGTLIPVNSERNCLIPEGRQPQKIKPAPSKTCREGI